MSRRRFFFPRERISNTGLRQRSWAECYAVPHHDSWSSDSDGSGRNSPDQSNTVDPNPPRSSSSSSLQVINLDPSSSSSSPSASPARNPSRPPVTPHPAPAPDHRSVLLIARRTQTDNCNEPSSSAPAVTREVQRTYSRDRLCSPAASECSHCHRTWSRTRRWSSRRWSRDTPQQRRSVWGHLPVAIPSDRWYTGVGSRVCAQCRFHRRGHRTSWMCLECRVPLCLLTYRNCYSQWHCGD